MFFSSFFFLPLHIFRTYKVDLEKRRAEFAAKEEAKKAREIEKLKRDLGSTTLKSDSENPESIFFLFSFPSFLTMIVILEELTGTRINLDSEMGFDEDDEGEDDEYYEEDYDDEYGVHGKADVNFDDDDDEDE